LFHVRGDGFLNVAFYQQNSNEFPRRRHFFDASRADIRRLKMEAILMWTVFCGARVGYHPSFIHAVGGKFASWVIPCCCWDSLDHCVRV